MDEASKLYVDSLTHDLGTDVSKFVHLYALIGKLRLVNSTEVVAKADGVMRRIVKAINLRRSAISGELPKTGKKEISMFVEISIWLAGRICCLNV